MLSVGQAPSLHSGHVLDSRFSGSEPVGGKAAGLPCTGEGALRKESLASASVRKSAEYIQCIEDRG